MSLILIFIAHSSFDISDFIQGSRGFSDASELFVMMSGMSAALAYYGSDGARSLHETTRRTSLRALKIFCVHLGLVAGLAVAVMLPAIWQLREWQGVLAVLDVGGFWNAPGHFALAAITLRYMPSVLDILPLYVLLLAAVPFIFVLHDWSRRGLLAVSLVMWLGAGLLHLNLVNEAMPKGGWLFNPLAWQLVFTIGVVAGVRIKKGLAPFPYHPVLFRAAASFALAAIPANLLALYVFSSFHESALFHVIASKAQVGVLRLVNVVALAYVLWNMACVRTVAGAGFIQPICAAGRHSLPVFCFGLVLSITLKSLMVAGYFVTLPLQLALLIGGCLAHLALAALLDGSRTHVLRQAAAVS